MRKIVNLILLASLSFIIFSCKSRIMYVPTESVKVEKEYIDKWYKDSVHIHDSIYLAVKGDTVYKEKYKTIYKDKIVKDSIFVTDSIRFEVPYPVDNPIPYYPTWLVILAICGSIRLFFDIMPIIKKLF